MFSQIIFSGFRKIKDADIDVEDARNACDVCEAYDITGLSLFNEGAFLTVMEGQEAQTKAIFEAFKTDIRLSEVQLIIDTSIDEREFNDFRIGFSHKDFSETVPKAFKLNATSFRNVLPENPSTELTILTDTFAKINALQ